jgi:uncharacterized protein (DUF2249 family)
LKPPVIHFVKNRIITLDVREDILAGHKPFSKIMNAVTQLRAGEDLQIIAPFETVPLMELLRCQGFQHTSSANAAGDWEVLFTRQPDGQPTGDQPAVPRVHDGDDAGLPPEIIKVDVRGLEPPQPLITILEALDQLAPQSELRARTDRRPMHLYAQLEARGFTGESQEQSDGSFITHIRHR